MTEKKIRRERDNLPIKIHYEAIINKASVLLGVWEGGNSRGV
jgi:hypothetical protein